MDWDDFKRIRIQCPGSVIKFIHPGVRTDLFDRISQIDLAELDAESLQSKSVGISRMRFEMDGASTYSADNHNRMLKKPD